MLNAMIDWLTVAGVLALVACPILGLSAVGAAKGWRASALYGRSLEDVVRSLNRRLADVEAIRAREPINMAEHPDHAAIRYLEELRMGEGDSVTILCDDPEAESAAKRMAIVCNGAWTQWEDRRFYGESIVQCLARGACEMRITPVDRPMPSMIREHLGDVVELGKPIQPIHGRSMLDEFGDSANGGKPVCAETEGDCS